MRLRPAAAVADLALLDAEERGHLAAFLRPEDRGTYGLAHAELRRTLSQATSRPPASLRFLTEALGRPLLLDSRGKLDRWRFSLSHCAAGVAIAICDGIDIGIDVEDAAEADDTLALAGMVATPEEATELASIGPSHRWSAFLRLWTRKEAVLKAAGHGLSGKPETLAVGCAPRSHGVTYDGARWSLFDLPCPWATVALAVAGPDATVIVDAPTTLRTSIHRCRLD